jgi:hypothetical protein
MAMAVTEIRVLEPSTHRDGIGTIALAKSASHEFKDLHLNVHAYWDHT